MKLTRIRPLGMGLLLPLLGCAGDDSSTDTNANDSTGEDTTGGSSTGTDPTGPGTTDPADSSTTMESSDTTGPPPMECLGIGGPNAVGDPCTANSDCDSGLCPLSSDVPLDGDAVCAETPADCSMRVTATIYDFVTGEAVGGAELTVAAALQAASNPGGATPLVSATADGMGRVDGTSDGPIEAALGIVGLVSAPGYFLTATGMAAPIEGLAYGVGNNIHDIWAVPEGELSDWSDSLGMDMEIPGRALPLGEAGGVVGLVRDGSTGAPIAGAVVASTNAGSGASVRYLQDDGTFGPDETSDLGIFVIVQPGVGETFEVTSGGAMIGGGTAGSAPGVVFTLVINAD